MTLLFTGLLQAGHFGGFGSDVLLSPVVAGLEDSLGPGFVSAGDVPESGEGFLVLEMTRLIIKK